MPTMRRTSAERCAISWLSLTPCASIASLNCAPMDLTGLSAFIALCMTTDRAFHLIAVSAVSLSPTMLRPRKSTLPSVISAGGESSCAIANSSVDLPQPDSPTIARNLLASSEKLTLSTALTTPDSSRYSTDRSRTSSTAPPSVGWSSAGRLDTTSPQWPQRGVSDLVEGVVDQRERRSERDDAKTWRDDPQRCYLERLLLLGPVEHRAPARHARVAEADELQARGKEHGVQRVRKEACDDERGHRRDDLDRDDVKAPLAAHPGGLDEVPAVQRQGLRSQLPRGIGPAGERNDRDQYSGARTAQVTADDDQQREQRDDQQHVSDQVEHAVPGAAEKCRRDADQDRDSRGAESDAERDEEHWPGAPHQLREHVLPERRGAKQVPGGDAEQLGVDLGVRVVLGDYLGECPNQAEDDEQGRAEGGLAVRSDRPDHAARGASACDPASGRRQAGRWERGTGRLACSGRCRGLGERSGNRGRQRDGHGYCAPLVRGSRIAVAMSAISIATSTATVIRRTGASMS